MDREEQLRRLPLAHAVALRLRDAGASDELIAAALGVELEGVGPLLEVGEAKADRIARRPAADEGQSAESS
jgi:hypothetical protein